MDILEKLSELATSPDDDSDEDDLPGFGLDDSSGVIVYTAAGTCTATCAHPLACVHSASCFMQQMMLATQ